MYEKLQNGLEKLVGPLATKLAASKKIQALTSGMLAATLITLGMALFCIIGNLPIPGWIEFLNKIGVHKSFQEMVTVTSGMMAIYMVAGIAYFNAKVENENGIISALLSLSAFMILVPLEYIGPKEHPVTMIKTTSLGTDGMFVALVLAMVISSLYCWLMKKNLKIKLPKSVPPMVADSLSPTFVAMIIFAIAFALKVGFALTSYGDIFTCINTVITKPFMNLGASPYTVIIVYLFISLLWFFGIHPAAIINIYFTSLTPVFIADVTAFIAGQPIPNLHFEIVATAVCVGGTGCTLGLAINMLRSKSAKFKSLSKLSIIPNVFNINEPIVFGVPVMLNPIFFIPMVFASTVSGIIALVFLKFGLLTFNPTIVLPWVTPSFVASFFNGGIMLTVLVLVIIVAQCLMYYPFFKIADKLALEEEQKQMAEENNDASLAMNGGQ